MFWRGAEKGQAEKEIPNIIEKDGGSADSGQVKSWMFPYPFFPSIRGFRLNILDGTRRSIASLASASDIKPAFTRSKIRSDPGMRLTAVSTRRIRTDIGVV
jgi:hypothetical protein